MQQPVACAARRILFFCAAVLCAQTLALQGTTPPLLSGARRSALVGRTLLASKANEDQGIFSGGLFKWKFNNAYMPGVALADQGFRDLPSAEWFKLVLRQVLAILLRIPLRSNEHRNDSSLLGDAKVDLLEALMEPFSNTDNIFEITDLLQDVKSKLERDDLPDAELLAQLTRTAFSKDSAQTKATTLGDLLNLLDSEDLRRPARSIMKFADFFPTAVRPQELIDTFLADSHFARMRTAGPNPNFMKRVYSLPETFPVTEAHFRSAIKDTEDSLKQALAEGRVYLADYGMFDRIKTGTAPYNQAKFIGAPYALFAVPKQGIRELKPVAIQCRRTPSATTNPVFTPTDGMLWTQAKSTVETADGNYHEAVAHLGQTHLVVEAFAVSAWRQLPQVHPLRSLLDPHFEGTTFINYFAHHVLLAKGGGVDSILAGTIEESLRIAVQSVQSYNFAQSMFPNAIKANGIDDKEVLPDHPYRDDGQLLWDALHEWVEAYVGVYYSTDAAVLADNDLQRWWTEVGAEEDGGKIHGTGKMDNTTYLTQALTHIIFTASCQHAAVNFPQGDLMAFVPNMPLAQFTDFPLVRDPTEAGYLEMLPPPVNAKKNQYFILSVLGGVLYTRLGYYGKDQFDNQSVLEALDKLHRALDRIEQTITTKNKSRVPYTYLLPSRIPQSINI